ncbi:hypothetical protein GO495_31505 [Chitinophaga oryziterrae]|uniref:Uncharacterized protein n=1 Tax=Chitinophaga oryziterrae TaxID=1031224 RepID=A0A6N8JIU4_9BACT|nr:hypothetical protein [Chitinophaga oryziterrae]MVT45157.1 hypothetical protein [Chitinophaga oryziterrae]
MPYFRDPQKFTDNLIYYTPGGCKSATVVLIPLSRQTYDTVTGYVMHIRKERQLPVFVNQRKPLLAVHGNVMYDLYYQSKTKDKEELIFHLKIRYVFRGY